MAVVDESNSLSNSLHDSQHDRTSNQSCSSPRQRQEAVTEDEEPKRVSYDPEVVSLDPVKNDDESEYSDEEEANDYLLDSLLRGPVKPSDPTESIGRPSMPRRNDLDRTYSNRSLRSKTTDLDRTYSSRSLACSTASDAGSTTRGEDDKPWGTTSLHSSASEIDEAKNWQGMDSVHSSTAANTMSEFGNASIDFNDSCCSFASFGGSDGDLNASSEDLSLQRAAFTNLADQPTPRRIMLKSQSVRTMKRGMSYRGTGLSLIEESNSLD